ncbi:hypothetical protein RSOLAG22IIIB_10479 [Rhizoctonia solani]|uniref:F-box domain-containing protein n=1 Tax=Rhizoctonia solani TaxID=456999 RepID=A0A0K6G3D7_9AGAM|nr:hypothetical protein RSOLAG22IIIB_10479 [Rhizoctonia solani]
MSLLPTRFPVELLTMVFAQQSPHDLASASLVCRQWQRAAFPHLYHTMYISEYTHLEVLDERLMKTDVPDSMSVQAHLKSLILCGSNINYVDPAYLDSIVPQLVHLTCLYWELPFTPAHFGPFAECPKLEAVHLVPLHMWHDDGWIERLPQLLTFTNLTHFSLKFEPIPYDQDDEEELYDTIASFIQCSPNLESIIISFQDKDGFLECYSPNTILENLGDQFVLPRLHTLHMLGAADPDWASFASNPTHSFRSFLARHPTIKDLAIGCPTTAGRHGAFLCMDPDDLSRLLPSVKTLAFPSFMWQSIASSKLASRLESIAISNLAFVLDLNPLGSIAEAMGENSFPNVRKVSILVQLGCIPLTMDALEGFRLAAEGLEEVEFELHIERATWYERRKTQFRVVDGEWCFPPSTGEDESEWDLGGYTVRDMSEQELSEEEPINAQAALSE